MSRELVGEYLLPSIIDTVFLAWFITGDFESALKIGFGEVFMKTFLYFLHEKVWNRIMESNEKSISHGKSFLKGIAGVFLEH